METVAAAETQSHRPIGRNRGARWLGGFSKAAGPSHPVAGRSSWRNLLNLAVLSVLCLLSVPLLHGKEHKRKVREGLRSRLFDRSGGARERSLAGR